MLVVPTVICSSVVAERVAAAAPPLGVALPHLAGCGQLGPDMRVTHETLAAYCGHPNVGAVAGRRARAASRSSRRCSPRPRARHGKPAEIVAIQAEGGTRARDRRRAARIAQAFAAHARPRASANGATSPSSMLSLKCGGSDYTSGLASNPTLGRVADRLVDLGGSAVLGEIAEIMGAEHLLAARATRPEIGRRS